MLNPMATTMTAQDTLFDALAEQHGGVDEMSPVELELVAALVRALLELPNAPAAELPRLARAVAQLSSQLPAPLEGEAQEIDLTKLSDGELEVLRRARSIVDGKGDPCAAEASGARERLLAKLEEIAARNEEYGPQVDYRRSLRAAEERGNKLQEQLDALLKLNALLEQRLAEEVAA
jgi:hypothetical protein